MFKFLHAADIHLDSPQRGLDRYEGAPAAECRAATRRALENLVDLAVAEKVAFVLIVGDLYDGDWNDYQTPLFFTRVMARLRDGGIPVYMIRGNHDAHNRMTRDLRLPDNVKILVGRSGRDGHPRGLRGRRARAELRHPRRAGQPGAVVPDAGAGAVQRRAAAHLRRRPRGARAVRAVLAVGPPCAGVRLLGAGAHPRAGGPAQGRPLDRLPGEHPGPARARGRGPRGARS